MQNQELFPENEEIFKLQREVEYLKKELQKQKENTLEADFLKPDKTFGVGVCGDVLLNKLEVKIVNSATFQRLRKVRQLGSTYFVYPSAVHTRFEHSLGTLQKADLIITRIRKNKHSEGKEKFISAEEEQIIRLIALLHDIGHMPFGHTIEDEFGIFRSHDKHETRWEYFLGEFSEIGSIILEHHPPTETNLYERFYRLIKCEKDFGNFTEDAFMYDIVSNTVCADLLDYLERDCLYTNLKLKFHPRFLNYFFIKNILNEETHDIERRIAIRIYKKGKKEIRHDVISELIQLLRYRYYLGERVYYHHTKIMTGTLLAGSVLRAKEAGCFKELGWVDANVVDKINSNNDLPADKVLYNIHIMGDEQLVLYLKNLPKIGKNKEQLQLIKNAERLAHYFDERKLYPEIKIWTKDNLGISEEDINSINDYIKEEKEKLKEHKRNKIVGKRAFKIYDRLISNGTYKNRIEVEDKICSYLPDMQSGDVLIYCPTFNMAMKLAKVKVAYISENDRETIELTSELKDLVIDDDKTTKPECHSILRKHQELWALRIFVNPKFVNPDHPEYKEEYSNYKEFIINFIEWQILGKNHEDEVQKGRKFWTSYLRNRSHKIGIKDLVYSDKTDEIIESISNDLAVHNKSLKNKMEIDDILKGKLS